MSRPDVRAMIELYIKQGGMLLSNGRGSYNYLSTKNNRYAEIHINLFYIDQVLEEPLENMPLYLNSENPLVVFAAKYRLEHE